jgi:hypothetical protein
VQPNDVTVVKGTLDNYHYRFIAEGKLMMRWLSCPCTSCMSKDWDHCHNKHWIGIFEPVEMKQLDQRGSSAYSAQRKKFVKDMLEKVQVDQMVALFTSEDHGEYDFWLARVMEPERDGDQGVAPTLTEKITCRISGEKFDIGEQVMWVVWYDRNGSDRVFRDCRDLGVFIVPAAMLRQCCITLNEYIPRSRRSGRVVALQDKQFELSEEQETNINHRITHDFKGK